MRPLILDRFGNEMPASGGGAVVLAPRPAKLFAKEAFIDREENHILNEAFIREIHQRALEISDRERSEFRRNWRTFKADNPAPIIAGGAAGAWTLTNAFRTSLIGGTNPAVPVSDSCKIALFQSTSNLGSGSTTYAAATNEVANANGYTTGGVATTIGYSGTTSVPITFTQAQWTASGGSITARFGVLYKVSGVVYGYFLCDSTPADVTATNGNTFTISAGTWATLA